VLSALKGDSTFDPAVVYAMDYIATHEAMARKLNKPLVMEEFGISRDSNRHDAGSAITIRDRYYQKIFEEIYRQASKPDAVIAGCNFWAWAGEGRPRIPAGIWKAGDDFIGDPPHETQGWYSIFDTDTSTQRIIKIQAERMNGLSKH
jgi:mannan endo-1,4-beta-mannosidase